MKVRIVDTIDYAHRLQNYQGKCSNIHGHTAKIVIDVQGNIDPETGMIVDFVKLKELVKPVLNEFDHRFIMQKGDNISVVPDTHITFFTKIPTAENMAKYIRDQLVDSLFKLGCVCTRVEFWETPNNCAIWEI